MIGCRYVNVEAAVSCCITDLILFSASVNPGGKLDTHWIPEDKIKRARTAADAVPERAVNVLLCVGGAGRSLGFAAAARTKSKRKALVSALVKVVEKHELDGVDFDWEAPATLNEMVLLRLVFTHFIFPPAYIHLVFVAHLLEH